jgi:hypothetical protein
VHILEQSRKMLSICERCKSRSACRISKNQQAHTWADCDAVYHPSMFFYVSELAITKAPDVHRTSASATVYINSYTQKLEQFFYHSHYLISCTAR